MAFNIRFDFRFDTSGFFTDAARAALDFAAGLWENVILDDFPDVLPGVSFTVLDPSGSGAREPVTLETPIDDVRIFVGVSSPPFGIAGDALARGGPAGFDVQGDTFRARISNDFRGQGPVTDFEPFAGTISFDPTVNWGFDVDNPAPGTTDFVMIAAHEIGHVLGIGTSGIFDQRSAGQGFDGPNARAVNNGQPIPLEADLSHITEGFAKDLTLMDPLAGPTGTRRTPTEFDLALLADIGFEIEGFEAQGSTPPIATNEGETIFGTVVDDVINGLSGDDQIQGNDGDDVLIGGPGDDNLFGGAGADIAVVAPGDGKATFNDFEVGIDRIQIDPGFGFTSAEAVLDTISKPFSNVSRLNLDAETTIDIFHDIQAGSPLAATDIFIGSLSGASGGDDISLNEPDLIGVNDDFELLQRTSPGVLSAGQGDDTYLVSPSTLNGDQELTLQDGQGSNRIQLVEGLQIAESTVAANALRLVLDNGAVINVNGADEFRFEAGANAVAGTTSTNVSFHTFVSETLGLQTPASGTVEGGSLVIGDASTPPDTEPTGTADDFVLLQRTSPGVLSAGQGGDTYILSENTLNGDENLTLQDGQGTNAIQLVEGLQIARSTVAANALQLKLANGSVINVNAADAFRYEPGGNAVAGVDGDDVSFETFVSETLGTDVPASGTSVGGPVIIGTASGTSLPVGTSQTISATGEAEPFTFDQQAEADTQIDLEGFDPATDAIALTLIGVTNLEAIDLAII